MNQISKGDAMRNVRISAISFTGYEDVDKSRKALLNLVDLASFNEPNLIVLPETCITMGVKDAVNFAEPVPGRMTEAMSAKARQYHSYIICPLLQRNHEGTVYNSSILIDPEGKVIGEYHKKHPGISEIEKGIRPGEKTPVFDVAFGRIGMCICYDLNFRDVIEGLSQGGAEIIFFVSAYEGGLQLQIWAFDFRVYVVSAHAGGYSSFIDVTGKIINKGDPNYNSVVTEELNLDRKIFSLDYNYEKLNEVRKKYGAGVKIDVHYPEDIFALESRMPDVTVNDIVKEFSLEYRRDHFIRANKVRQKALKNK